MPMLAYVPDNLMYETKCIKIITDSVAYTLGCNKISCVVFPKTCYKGQYCKMFNKNSKSYTNVSVAAFILTCV